MIIITSIRLSELGAADEAEESRAGVVSADISCGQLGVEMVVVQRLVPVDGEVTIGIVRARNPDLRIHAASGANIRVTFLDIFTFHLFIYSFEMFSCHIYSR